MSAERPLLEVRGLEVCLGDRGAGVRVVDGVDLSLGRGRSLGLVGESGAGKSQLALAIPGLGPPGVRVGGSVRFDGEELVGAPAARLRQLRGAAIGSVFQDPGTALAPHLSIGTQLTETLAAHRLADRAGRRRAALEMLERVRVPDAAARLGQYPHELSGGLRQRVMLAMALVARPALLIADEPTTALDVTVEAGVLALLRELVTATGAALLLVSHDLAVVAGLCDEIAVLYAGRIVESGPAARVLGAPCHPYTAGLAAATLTLETPLSGLLPVIAGAPPAPGERGAGCAFAPRCGRAIAACRVTPPPLATVGDRQVACLRPLDPDRAP